MTTRALTRANELLPAVLDDFFKPWNQWFRRDLWEGRPMTMPAVNIIENKDDYMLSLAAPGLKKGDFEIDIQGNTLTISCEKEEKTEDKDARHSRREYSYSSFSRSFTLPENVNEDSIAASYENGILKVTLPKKEEARNKQLSKQITVK